MYRLLLDENVERSVLHTLRNYGHDVEHVDTVAELGKQAPDGRIGAYSRDHDRLVVTYDDDFVVELGPEEYRAVLYIGDATVRGPDVAAAVHRTSEHYPQSEMEGVVYLDEWL